LTKLTESRILACEVACGKDDKSVETGEKKSDCKETLFICLTAHGKRKIPSITLADLKQTNPNSAESAL
jgi:hypothetical protein